MCGICGMVGKSDKMLLQAMCNSLIHRGPEDEGIYLDQDVAIGVRQLKISVNENSSQPICNEDASVYLVCDGRIFNHFDIKRILEDKGHRFKTRLDTEVILHAYEEYAEECVEQLEGMFAFAIWDARKRKLILARDRIGIKPLYYWYNGKYLVFGSEIKALLQDRNFPRHVDFTSLYNYLSLLNIPGEHTIFKGIKRLNHGYILIYDNDANVSLRQYWRLSFPNKIAFNENECCKNLYSLFSSAVKKNLDMGGKIGAFLSGGVDSSSIVAMMSQFAGEPVKTFSLGFKDKNLSSLDELLYARKVSKHLKTNHYELLIDSKDVLSALPKILWHFDEPYAGGIPQYFISKLAKEHVDVVLNGAAGDELFGDYGRSYRYEDIFTYQIYPKKFKKDFLKIMISILPNFTVTRSLVKRAKRFVDWASQSIPSLYADSKYFSADMKNNLLVDEIIREVDINRSVTFLFERFFNEAPSKELWDKLFYVDWNNQFVNQFLTYSDRLSMAYALENRCPFLDKDLVEFVLSIPPKYRSKKDDLKYLLKKSLEKVLPIEYLSRQKQGFMLPIGLWIKNGLNELVRILLSKKQIINRAYFNWDLVNKIIEEHMSNKKDNTYLIWSLINFEIWHRIYIDNYYYEMPDFDSLEVS